MHMLDDRKCLQHSIAHNPFFRGPLRQVLGRDQWASARLVPYHIYAVTLNIYMYSWPREQSPIVKVQNSHSSALG